MKLRQLIGVAVLLSWLPLFAQQQEMASWLNSGTKDERLQRLHALGIEDDRAESVSLPSLTPVHWHFLRTRAQEHLAVLFLPCSTGDSAYLYLMAKEKETWHVRDQINFDCHYDNSVAVEIASIRDANFDEVLVHHDCEAHGTGLLSQYFKVLDVSGSKFKVVLDTEEVVSVSRVPIGSYERSQRSTFVVVPTHSSLSRLIEETRSSTVNGKLSVQRRYFRWASSQGRFQPSRFVTVEQEPSNR